MEVRSSESLPLMCFSETKTNDATGGLMLRWSAIFLVIAIVAAVFGFGGIALAAAGIAKILFFVFLILFLISLISGLSLRRRV
jgi:uncharacterized membrane protein YtjA (UPF0391 family)